MYNSMPWSAVGPQRLRKGWMKVFHREGRLFVDVKGHSCLFLRFFSFDSIQLNISADLILEMKTAYFYTQFERSTLA